MRASLFSRGVSLVEEVQHKNTVKAKKMAQKSAANPCDSLLVF